MTFGYAHEPDMYYRVVIDRTAVIVRPSARHISVEPGVVLEPTKVIIRSSKPKGSGEHETDKDDW